MLGALNFILAQGPDKGKSGTVQCNSTLRPMANCIQLTRLKTLFFAFPFSFRFAKYKFQCMCVLPELYYLSVLLVWTKGHAPIL